MIKVNNKTITDYKIAIAGVMYDNSLNPTGLGSTGIYFSIDKDEFFIGLKQDVIDVFTSFNTHTFINLPDNSIDNYKQSLYGKKNYRFDNFTAHRVYLKNYEILLDTQALGKVIYFDSKDIAAKVVKNTLFKDHNGSYGAILHYYSSLNVEQNLLNIGLLAIEGKEECKLIVNKNITTIESLKDEYRYSIWWLKQYFTNDLLTTNNEYKVLEQLNVGKEWKYFDYFNKQRKVIIESDKTPKQFTLKPNLLKRDLATIDNHSCNKVNNLNSDVFIVNGAVKTVGIDIKNNNHTNFGLKEARHGYFDLTKDKSFNNIGYVGNDFIWGDNFYVDTAGFKMQSYVSKFKLPNMTINIPIKELFDVYPIGTANKTKEEDKVSKQRLKEYSLYILHNTAKLYTIDNFTKDFSYNHLVLSAKTALTEFIKSLFPDVPNSIIEYMRDNISIKQSVMFMNKDKTHWNIGDTVVFIHPFYNKAFYYTITLQEELIRLQKNNSVILPTGEVFGFNDKSFIWRGIEKEYRKDLFVSSFTGYKVFKDLSIKDYSDLTFNKCLDIINDKKKPGITAIIDWFNDYKNTCGMYVVDTKTLASEMKNVKGVSKDKKFPFGTKYGYCYL